MRTSYTASFKLAVCSYAEEFGNRAAGRKYDLDEKNVRRWRQNKTTLKSMPSKKRAMRSGKARWPELEEQLLAWVVEKRAAGHAVSTQALRLKARNIADETGMDDFKAGTSWAYRFMKRHDLSFRRRTHIAQRLPEELAEKTTRFQRYVIRKRRQHNYPLDRIGNADQTPLTFDVPSSSTISAKGVKSVSVMTTGHEKDRFTVMLSCTADGGKLPPYVVFKRKTIPKGEFPGVIVRAQKKGWMDQDLVEDWLRVVWGRRVGGLSRKRSMLVLDAFRCHNSAPTKEVLREYNTDLVMIPGGMTSILQPLDVGVNKPFKDGLRRCWTDWMLDGAKTFTKGGRMRKADLPTICGWIKKVWEELSPAIIQRAFLKCSISNSMDGTQDDLLWEDEMGEADESGESDDDLEYPDDEEDLRRIFNESSSDEEFEGF